MPDFARPASQFDELSNCDLLPVRSANAPAAMYFVISVLPISMTSGVSLPAIVASNFWRWSPQLWYWTLTVQPGFCCSNCWLAAATTSGQPVCASTWSQTVSVFAWALPLLALAVAATTPSAATSRAAPITRSLMQVSSSRRRGT